MIDLLPPDQICRTLGSRVRARRLVANLTQAELAARAGCSLSSVRRLEGQGQATLELLVRVAQALHALDGLEGFMALPQASIAQMERAQQAQNRQRARTKATRTDRGAGA